MPGLPRSGVTAFPSRANRIQALLNLSDASLNLAASAPALNSALMPFRRRYGGPQSTYDCVAFVHCFGVKGPCPVAWHVLFSASNGLRAEEVTVLVAHAITGGEGKADASERRRVMGEVVLGNRDVPGILHKVCNLFDDWLISVEALHDRLTWEATEEAKRWWIEKVSEQRFVWIRGDGAAVEVDGSFQEDALGDGMSLLARRIGIAVVKEVVEESMRRVSFEGVHGAVARVRERGEVFVEVATGRAISVLIRKVMEALGMPDLPRLPWE